MQRKLYAKYAQTDRNRVVQDAKELRDSRANTFRAKLSHDEIDGLVEFLESDRSLTMNQLRDWVQANYDKTSHATTIEKYLLGRTFSYKSVHYKLQSMNSQKKIMRREYVRPLLGHMEKGIKCNN